jgi:PAS domain S-box-containing protein
VHEASKAATTRGDDVAQDSRDGTEAPLFLTDGSWADDGQPTVQLLADIIEQIAYPVFVKDRLFRYVLVNRALCEVTGFARDQMLGKQDSDFIPLAAGAIRQQDIGLFESETRVSIEEDLFIDARGQQHVLTTTKVPLRGADGKVKYLVGAIHDLSRLKAAEQALRDVNELLERRVQERTAALAAAQEQLLRNERLAVVGQIAGGLAHQIRNPLGSITNAGYILKRLLSRNPAPDMDEPTTIILEEAWRANRIITGLLEYTRARPPHPVACSVQQVLRATVQTHMIPDSIEVVDQLPDLPDALADPDQLREVFANLIQNAIEAMPQGGKLSLLGRVDALTSAGPRVVVDVRDTGTGIPASVRSRLFEPLVSSKPAGLGLGLTSARMLLENQGGTIGGQSAPGEGACFQVSLPVAPPGAGPA